MGSTPSSWHMILNLSLNCGLVLISFLYFSVKEPMLDWNSENIFFKVSVFWSTSSLPFFAFYAYISFFFWSAAFPEYIYLNYYTIYLNTSYSKKYYIFKVPHIISWISNSHHYFIILPGHFSSKINIFVITSKVIHYVNLFNINNELNIFKYQQCSVWGFLENGFKRFGFWAARCWGVEIGWGVIVSFSGEMDHGEEKMVDKRWVHLTQIV